MMHMPHIPEPKSPRAQLAVIAAKLILVLVIVALVAASVVQQHNQTELRKAQRAATAAHNDGACGMRVLTHTLITRTQAALARPTTRPEDKPGFVLAISAYQALNNAQVTVPRGLDCRVVLQHP